MIKFVRIAATQFDEVFDKTPLQFLNKLHFDIFFAVVGVPPTTAKNRFGHVGATLAVALPLVGISNNLENLAFGFLLLPRN